MPTIAQHPVTRITNVILGEGEKITEQFNNEKVVIYRRDSTTNWEAELIKPLGALATAEQLRVNAPKVCNYNEDGHDPNPIHEHEDGTWWFFDELWSLENGPFPTFDEAYNALAEYCIGLETAQTVAAEMAAELAAEKVSTESIVKQLTKKFFPKGAPEDEDDTTPAKRLADSNLD